MKWLFSQLMTALARMYIGRFRPTIVAITGNAGKTSTRQAVAAVLASAHRVRTAGANLNTPLGVSATILGAPMDRYERDGGTAGFWGRALLAGLAHLVSDRDHPDIIVLEYGADQPGDIATLTGLFPPQVGVITQVGQVPVHVEYFASPQHLAQEKMQLIRHLGVQDHAVLNYDDQTVLDMRGHTQAHVHTFGTAAGADVQAADIATRLDDSIPLGIGFDVVTEGHTMHGVINGTVGRGIASSAVAAVCVGRIFNIGLADAVAALAALRPPAGRMRILRGIKETVIIDDSYNASPAAMHLALDTVKNLPARRRVLVLGDMLELGEHTVTAHQAAGDMAGSIADILVCVGERAKFIADSAGNQMPKENIHTFHESSEAAPVVQKLLKQGDLVLVKASQGKRMERIVKEIMAEPDRASELLVRQSSRWLSK